MATREEVKRMKENQKLLKERQKRIIVNHYLANKDNKLYDPRSSKPAFSLNKMAEKSVEELGFYVCKDSLSNILEKAGVRPKDYSMRRRHVGMTVNHNYFWNSFLMWKLR